MGFVFPVVGNVVPELSKNLIAGATLTDDLMEDRILANADVTGTMPTSPSYRA